MARGPLRPHAAPYALMPLGSEPWDRSPARPTGKEGALLPPGPLDVGPSSRRWGREPLGNKRSRFLPRLHAVPVALAW